MGMRTWFIVAFFLACIGQASAETYIEVRFSENPPRLYLLHDGEVSATYTVAVARPSEKLRLPVEGKATQVWLHAPWYPTQLSREAYAKQHKGEVLPAMVPYGDPRNQMGVGKILLVFPPDWTTKPLRIHGTTELDSIGKRMSSGCVRMFDSDLVDLARRLEPVKLPIKIHFRE